MILSNTVNPPMLSNDYVRSLALRRSRRSVEYKYPAVKSKNIYKPIHIDTHHSPHRFSFPLSSLPASLNNAMKLSSPPTSHAFLPMPPLQPRTPSTSSFVPYSLPSRAPNTATAVLMMTPSPSNTITSHTRTAVSTPKPFPGPRKRVRIIGSSTSCAVRPSPVGAASKRCAWRRGNL